MRVLIKEFVLYCVENFFLKTSRQFARIFSSQKRLLVLKQLPTSSIGNIETGQKLLNKKSLFGNVLLDVKTENPWRILPFSEEVEIGINGFSWLNDLAIINNESSRELSKSWIDLFPLERLNRYANTSSSRLAAIVRNFSFLEINSDSRKIDKLNKILRNDYFFLNFYKNFSFNVLERLTIYHSLVLSSYAFSFTKKKQKKTIRVMIKLLDRYKNMVKTGYIRNPEELSEIFFYLLETLEITKSLDEDQFSVDLDKLRKISYVLGSSLRYLQFGNGDLISAHGGCVGDHKKYVKLIGSIKRHKGADKLSNLGFHRLDGARMSIIIDTSPPIYGRIDGVSHAGFSSFELYYGTKPIFVNCGGGSRFGHQYRKYCQSSKAHNILLFNERSQCSFGKKYFSGNMPYYYTQDGPNKTTLDCEKSITEKTVELSHDGYEKDYGIYVHRRLTMDLVKNSVIGKDSVVPISEPKKSLIDTTVSVYFHIHPSVVYKNSKDGVLLKLPGEKKMLFTHRGGKLSIKKSTYVGNSFEPRETTKLVIEKSFKQNNCDIHWKIEEIIG